jgi:hypothetical protein
MKRRSKTHQINLIKHHLQTPILSPKPRPRSPLDPLGPLPILQLIIHSPMQHNITAALAERVNHRGLVRAAGDFFPHAVAHFDDACESCVSGLGTQKMVIDLLVFTVSTLGLFRRHDKFCVAREVIRILLVSGRGIRDGVEALEERGDAGFEGAVFGDGGDVLLGHFVSSSYLFLLSMRLDDFQLVGLLVGEWCCNEKVRFVIVTSASLGYFEAASEERKLEPNRRSAYCMLEHQLSWIYPPCYSRRSNGTIGRSKDRSHQ